ncbi:YdeI/OmpD-associated family protein [Gemmobacter denitrificans]|uniref:YdeI/OmpD-associated family protein n=1 Tax=Gemmobacter denitrificans TaxID=3123040 RepID=A0ABU8BWR6_9RHOB
MITEIGTYFRDGCGRCARFATPDCAARFWADGLAALRALCLGAGLDEQVKWGHPCYMHAGRNIAVLGAFRSDFRITFQDAALLSDPQGLLQRQGPNTRHPDMLQFRDAAQVADRAGLIRDLLAQAMQNARAGLRPPSRETPTEIPTELQQAMSADPDLAAAFAALTPGRQRSHALQISGAKTAATRLNRIARLRPLILAGRDALGR